MKFTPIALAAAMAGAVYCAEYLGTAVSAAAVTVFICLFVVRFIFTRKADMVIFAVAAGFVLGSVSYAFYTSSYMHRTAEYTKRYVTLRGVILTQGRRSAYDDNYRYIMRVSSISDRDSGIDCRDNILLVSEDEFSCGEGAEVKGIIKEFPKKMNENGFDTAMYYKSQNVTARIFSEDTEKCDIKTVISPYIIAGKLRGAVERIIYKYYYGDSAAVLSAVLTGNTDNFSKEYGESVDASAFKRQFHPAYIHIMLISVFFGLFASVIPKKLRDVLMIIVLLGYAVCGSAQIGFVRCVVMAAMTLFFKLKYGSAYYPDTMAWIVIICAALCPTVLFNAAFVLSVCAGMLMWAFLPFVTRLFKHLPKNIARTASAMTVSALFYTPLSSVYFNGLCIYAFLSPFITVPAVIIILLLAPLVFAMLGIFGAAPIVKGYFDFMIWIMLKLPGFMESLPLSDIIMPSPSPSQLLMMICIIFTVYYCLRGSKRKRNAAVFAACAMAAASVISASLRIGTVNFTFVNVGQGDGAVIHRAFGETVIIDGGGGVTYSEYNPGESIFVPYLRSKGYGRIDAAFVSHLHQDHVQGIISAIETLKVGHVFVSPPSSDKDEDMKQWRAALEKAAAENGTQLHYFSENERIRFDSGLVIDVYVPNDTINFSSDGNDTSVILKVCYGETEALYTGDITAYAERQYIKSGIDLSADILKTAHHGSAGSTSDEWVQAVSPQYAVISCGENNSYGHPSKETLERLSGCRVIRTDESGDITFTADREKIKKITVLR